MPYQSLCHPHLYNGECSENFACRCALIVSTQDTICTLQVQCSWGIPCNVDYSCSRPGTICVQDYRCGVQPLCYPIALSSPDICSPLATSDNLNSVE